MLWTMTWEEPTYRFTTSMTSWQRAQPALNTSTLRLLSMVCLQLQTHLIHSHPYDDASETEGQH